MLGAQVRTQSVERREVGLGEDYKDTTGWGGDPCEMRKTHNTTTTTATTMKWGRGKI